MILRSSPATREILYIWSSPLKIRSSSWRQYEKKKKHPQTHGVAMGRKKMAVFLFSKNNHGRNKREETLHWWRFLPLGQYKVGLFIDQQANTLHPLIKFAAEITGIERNNGSSN